MTKELDRNHLKAVAQSGAGTRVWITRGLRRF